MAKKKKFEEMNSVEKLGFLLNKYGLKGQLLEYSYGGYFFDIGDWDIRLNIRPRPDGDYSFTAEPGPELRRIVKEAGFNLHKRKERLTQWEKLQLEKQEAEAEAQANEKPKKKSAKPKAKSNGKPYAKPKMRIVGG